MIELSKGPPPLPQDERPETGFGKYAAWLGLLLPLIIIGLSAGYGYWMKSRQVPSDQFMVVMTFLGMAACFFLVVGLVCSVVSFAGHGENRSGGLVLVGVLGFMINAGLLGSGVLGGLRAVKARTTGGDLHSLLSNLNQSLKNEYATNGTVEYRPERIASLLQSLDKVAATGSSKDARVAKAIKEFLGEFNERVRGLQQEGEVLIRMKPLDPLPLKSRADLQMRKSTIANFLKRNQELRKYVEDAEAKFNKHLQSAGLSDAEMTQASQSFWRNFGPKKKMLLQIRDCDQRMGESIAAALDIYDQHWMKWHADEQGRFAGLDDQAATDEVFRLKGVIQQAAAEQAELQGAYVKSL